MSTINDFIIRVHALNSVDHSYGIWVESNGFDESQATLLFLHGYMSNNEVYDPLMEKYREDYNVISLDLRGHGNSDTPQSEAWEIEDFAFDIYQVVKSIVEEGHKINIIASSLSTGIALELASSYPKLVDKLFLISPTYNFETSIRGKIMQNLGKLTPIPIVETLFEVFNFVVPLIVLNEEKKELVKENFTNAMRLDMRTHRKILGETIHGWSVDPTEIMQKTLIVAGKHDWVVPYNDSVDLNEMLPRSSMVTLDGSKHFILSQEFEFISKLLDKWLNKEYKILRYKFHFEDKVLNL